MTFQLEAPQLIGVVSFGSSSVILTVVVCPSLKSKLIDFQYDVGVSQSTQNSTLELVNGQTTTVTLKHQSCDGSISAGYCRASCLE